MPDDVLLFRYSALTFNGHRIHYDRRYVTEVEGYPGLVVHGPLIATLLLDLLRRELPDASVARFSFRAVEPAVRRRAVLRSAGGRGRWQDACALGRATRRRAGDGGDGRRSPASDTRRRTTMVSTHPTSTRTSATRCARSARSFPTSTSARSTQQRAYPEAFVDALTEAGWLAALIPEEYGGSGLGLTEASVIMEEINRCGGNSGAVPRPDVQHGHAAAPRLARRRSSSTCRRSPRGELRLQSMARDRADDRHRHDEDQDHRRASKGDRYVVNGQKVWISRVQHSDLMILLARTTPLAEVKKKSEGMSIFLVDLREAIGHGHDGAADPQHGQPRDQRAVLRQPRDPGREPDRRGRARASGTSSTGSTPSAR